MPLLSKIKKGLGLVKKAVNSNSFKSRIAYGFLKNIVKSDSTTILYESYHGKSMTCNPYALYCFMLDDKRFKAYTHIWVIEDPQYIKPAGKNTKIVKRHSLKNAYYLLKAKYLINNTTFLSFFNKRDEQIYINTWHGTPLKTLGKDVKFGYGNAKNVTKNLLQADFFISPNQFTTNVFLRSNDIDTLFTGKIIENGYPRNDLLFIGEERQKHLYEELGIAVNKKIILYAPTFRGNHLDSQTDNQKFLELLKLLDTEFENEYTILTKLHHVDYNDDLNIQKVPGNIDTNELLSIVDILITDYSSIAFDFLPLKRPIIRYVFDLDGYINDRGFYLDIEKIAGALCHTTEEVSKEIRNIDTFMQSHADTYTESIDTFCSYEDGHVTNKVIEAIFFNNTQDVNSYQIPGNKKKKVLLYGGGFLNNGVTTSLLGVLANISYDAYEIYLVSDGNVNGTDFQRIINQIPKNVKVLYLEQSLLKLFQAQYRFLPLKYLEYLFREQNNAFFGTSEFDIAIDYSGYGSYWASIIAFANAKNKYIYLHNDMKAESLKRGHLLDMKYLLKLYQNQYDGLITVSQSSHHANINSFPKLCNKIKMIENPIDIKRIKNLAKIDEPFAENLDTHKVNFINIARYSVQKGQDRLIEAFAKLTQKHTNIHLYIVGHGPLHKNLKRLIDTHNMNDHITLTGNMENPFNLLKKCDCFVLSSHYEGQGIVLLEALILNIPCLSTDIPGPQSILSKDQGLLVEDSVNGLIYGMEKFLDAKIPHHTFDYKHYTDNAMQSFYEVVV